MYKAVSTLIPLPPGTFINFTVPGLGVKSFELVACKNVEFDNYIDTAALLKIKQNDEIFIGWFFKYTDELNLYSNKIYEISLIDC